jgi:hypothetical protein
VTLVPRQNAVHRLLFEDNLIKGSMKAVLPGKARRWIARRVARGNLHKPKLREEDRRSLVVRHREDILRTQDLLGRDLSAWLRT